MKKSFLALIIMLVACEAQTQRTAEKGVFDLTTGILEPIELNGQWDFFWQSFLHHEDIQNLEDRNGSGTDQLQISTEQNFIQDYVEVPGLWNRMDPPLPGFGYATYRLNILLPEEPATYSFDIPYMATAYSFFLNGEKVYSSGIPGKSRDTTTPLSKPGVVTRTLQGSNEIIIHVANFHHRNGGMWHPIKMGLETAIKERHLQRLGMQFFIWGALAIIGIYHLVIFLIWQKDYIALYLGFFTLLMAFREVLTGDVIFSQIFPGFPYEWRMRFEYWTFFLGLFSFTEYFRRLYFQEVHFIIARIISLAGLLGFIFTLLTPLRLFSHSIPLFLYFLAVCGFYGFYVVLKALFHSKKKDSIIMLFSMVLMLVGLTASFLHFTFIFRSSEFFPAFFLVFIMLQSVIFARRVGRSHKEVEALSEKLVEMDRLKDEFMASTSHEIRTPLNGMIGIAESILQSKKRIEPYLRKDIELIVESGRKLSNLVNDVMDLSRLQHHDLKLSKAPLDLFDQVEMVLNLSRPLTDGKSIELINNIGENLPPLYADETRFIQIMHNLIGNAIKFTDEGFVQVDAFIENGMFTISVEDSGQGVKDEDKEKIFESYTQLESVDTRRHGGTGLGLPITRNLVNLHGGKIHVEDGRTGGARFVFSLPADISENDSANTLEKFKPKAEPEPLFSLGEYKKSVTNDSNSTDSESKEYYIEETKSGNILIIDDESINRTVLKRQLGHAGYTVFSSASGKEGLEILENEHIDLVILDLMMPEMTGYDVCKIIREDHTASDLPVLILTAKSSISNMIQGFEAGANDYLIKPFERRELLARTEALIGSSKGNRSEKKLISIQKDLETARRVQEFFTRKDLPTIPGVSIIEDYVSSGQIGGDYFNIHKFNDDGIGIFLADVSGHSVSSALIAAMLDVCFTIEKNRLQNPEAFLNRIREILSNKFDMHFITAVAVYIDRKNMKLHYGHAGHPPLILQKRKTGEILPLKSKGRLITWIEDTGIQTASIPLDTSDRIILYTDGLTDALDGQMQIRGMEILMEIANTTQNLPKEELSKRLRENTEPSLHLSDDEISWIIIDIEETSAEIPENSAR